MRSAVHRFRLLVSIGAATGISLHAAEPAAAKGSPYVAPLPAVVAFAEKQNIPLDRLEVGAADGESRAGDSVTALITLYEDEHYRQWLLRVATVELTAQERAAKPPRPMTLFLSSGNKFTFTGARMAIDVRLMGPFRDDASPTAKIGEKHARTLVNQEFLGLGFDRTAAAAMRMTALGKADPAKSKLGVDFSTKPFSPEAIAKGRAAAEALGFTIDDERSLAAISPALLAFFDVVQKTPGLSDVLAEILNKTSLAWSALTHGGKLEPAFNIDTPNISLIETERWGPALPPAYRFPFLISLNQKPTLYCQLVVTAPRPPLHASAGIIGVVVGPPDDTTKVLVIRVLAGRHSDAPAPP